MIGEMHIRHIRKYEGALSDYNLALQLNPVFAIAYYNKGLIYEDKGEYVQAIQRIYKGHCNKP